MAETKAPATVAKRYADLEADGLPAQVAPPASIRTAPDDPSEPFSPNYGRRASASDRPLPAPAALTEADADALVIRAIGEHEMRRP